MQSTHPYPQPRTIDATIKDWDSRACVERTALVEGVIFLTGMLALDTLAGDGTRFIEVSPHPFWIIVLLVTMQYGIAEALIIALMASIFLLVGNLPERSLSETIYEYSLRVMFLPCLWTITALVLGSIRTRQISEKRHFIEQLAQNKEAMGTLVKSYKSVKQAKERLELRLAQERCSIQTVYKMACTLEAADADELQPALAELVRVALRPHKFSFYRWENNAMVLESSCQWEKQDAYARQFRNSSPLVQAMLDKRRVISLTNEGDEDLLRGEGIMACAIRNEKTGKILGMLKIEDIGFMDMGSHTQETLRVVCEWIGQVYANRLSQVKDIQVPRLPENILQVVYAKAISRVAA